jgi:hypothetical protein
MLSIKGAEMKRALLSTALAMLALALHSFAATSATAATSPDVLFETGGALPVTLVGENATVPTEWQSSAGFLKGTGLKFAAELSTSNHEGVWEIVFENVKYNAESCSNTTTSGEVRASGNLKLVYDTTINSGGGALLNVPLLTVKCGEVTVKAMGSLIGLIKETNVFRFFFNLTLQCSATVGEPTVVKYWENEVESHALYQMNFAGYKKACVLFGESSTFGFSTTASKMIKLDA